MDGKVKVLGKGLYLPNRSDLAVLESVQLKTPERDYLIIAAK